MAGGRTLSYADRLNGQPCPGDLGHFSREPEVVRVQSAGGETLDADLLLIAPLLSVNWNPRCVRARRLVAALHGRGYEVGVVTAQVGAGDLHVNRDQVVYAAPAPERSPASGTASDIRSRLRQAAVAVARVVLPFTDSMIGWAIGAYRELRRYPKPPTLRAIYAMGYPHSAFALGAALSRRWGVPLVIDAGDPWPARGPLELWLRRWSFQRADALVVASETMAVSMAGPHHSRERVFVAPNGADELRSERGNGLPLVLHVGSLNRDRIDPGPAFSALAELAAEGRIEFVSHGQAWVPLPAKAAQHHHGTIDAEGAHELTSRASILLILGNQSAIGLPSKTFGLVRSDVWGLFVSELDWELGAELVRETAHGLVVHENSQAAIRKAALAILEREREGERPQPSSGYSWDRSLERMVEAVELVAGGPS